jgi:hypothetical protein
LHEVEIDIELARQGSNRGKHLQPFRASGRLDLARRFAALNLADCFPRFGPWRASSMSISTSCKATAPAG